MGVFVSMLSLVFLTCFGEDIRNFLQNEEQSGAEGKGILEILDEMGLYNKSSFIAFYECCAAVGSLKPKPL